MKKQILASAVIALFFLLGVAVAQHAKPAEQPPAAERKEVDAAMASEALVFIGEESVDEIGIDPVDMRLQAPFAVLDRKDTQDGAAPVHHHRRDLVRASQWRGEEEVED